MRYQGGMNGSLYRVGGGGGTTAEERRRRRGGGVFSLPLKRGRGGGGGDPNGPRGMSRVLPKGIIPTEMVRATEKII